MIWIVRSREGLYLATPRETIWSGVGYREAWSRDLRDARRFSARRAAWEAIRHRARRAPAPEGVTR